jgi:hypothetical protein
MIPTSTEMEKLARHKSSQTNSKNKGKQGGKNSHADAEGARGGWDEVSDASFGFSQQSSAFGGGTSDFG